MLYPFFFAACQSTGSNNNLTFTENTFPTHAATTQSPQNQVLDWEWCIEADKYSELYFIADDLLAAKEANEQYVIVNLTGQAISPHSYSNVSRFENGIALVKDNETFYFINRKGENIFNEIFEEAYSFSDGLAAIKKDGSWGFINEDGKITIANQFEKVNRFNETLHPSCKKINGEL